MQVFTRFKLLYKLIFLVLVFVNVLGFLLVFESIWKDLKSSYFLFNFLRANKVKPIHVPLIGLVPSVKCIYS